MQVETEPVPKRCEVCGRDFSCGATTGKCWCFDVELSAETLAKLRKDFQSCLCPECLNAAGENEFYGKEEKQILERKAD